MRSVSSAAAASVSNASWASARCATAAAASIELAVRGGRTVVTGVLAGPSPAAYEVEAASDRCQVRRLVASSCPAPCGFGEACLLYTSPSPRD